MNCTRFLLALASLILAPTLVFAGDLPSESEFNDTFFNRNILDPGVSIVLGELEPRDIFPQASNGGGIAHGGGGFAPHGEEGDYALYVKLGSSDPFDLVTQVGTGPNDEPLYEYNGSADFQVSDTLFFDSANYHSFFNQVAGTPFVAVTDNTIGADDFGPDITLGWMDFPEPYTQLETDDDSSPLGDGLASSLSGLVNDDGAIHLAVSGFPDFDFDGFSDDDGCDGEICPGEQGDVDFVSFTGLNPGEFFFATATSEEFVDTLLGVFDNEGTPLAANDDFGTDSEIQQSALGGIVPANGTLNLAVSGSGDNGFFGFHFEQGQYTLEVQTAPLGMTGDLPIGDLVELPTDENDEDGIFFFDDVDVIEDRPIFLDPEVAVGYVYAVDGSGINFASVQLPMLMDDSEYTLTFLDALGEEVTVPLSAGDVFDFPAGGVNTFTVNGIDISELLDPNDETAFVTGVTFTGSGSVDITQTAITAPIPEPATLALAGLGLLLGVARRRRC